MYSDFGQICDGFGAESFSGPSGISRVQTIAPDVVNVAEIEHARQDDQRMSNSDNTEKKNAQSITNVDTKLVKISTPTSKEHLFTITRSLTFQQFLMDAASYWSLPAAQVVLCDQRGGIWPLLEPVMTTLASTENLEKNVILDIKHNSWASSFAHLEEACTSKLDQVELSTPRSVSSTLYDDLWGIFTFYCVQGGNLQVDLMKAHQFTKLLQDCQLLNKVVKLEIMSMISKCEINNGKAQINFEEFLNLITRIAKLARAKDFKCVQHCNNEEEALYRLVFDQILPRASRWPKEQWDLMTTKLREPEVIMFFFGHLKALVTIFIFYARSYHTNPSTGMREFYMSYQNLQRFINDFLFAKLQISTVSCAQVFLAACSSRPFHLSASHDVNQCSKMLHSESSCSKSFIAAKDVEETRMATIRNLIAASGVVVAYTMSVTSESRKACMGFSAFIDFLGRASLTAYTKSKPIPPVLCVKALIHHICSEATNARVMEIIENHGSTCIHGNTFYLGTAAFRTKFFATWKEEGFPDYLTADVHLGHRTGQIPSHLEPRKSQPTAPLGKSVTSAFQSDIAVRNKASASGREILDRMLKSKVFS
uniref:Uncharacterized protein AlNc14C63G4547 n=1 Tax=Albugo laibachii Nc14 TaxID=890382 RepID=F0WD26_9STRA|nr:hypothetical protein PITG_02113 [Albugo laibachii Nc14]|eukprot:CCA19098.1 hypothetical protein PITG_02113 [Albugo laibachii Nc14]